MQTDLALMPVYQQYKFGQLTQRQAGEPITFSRSSLNAESVNGLSVFREYGFRIPEHGKPGQIKRYIKLDNKAKTVMRMIPPLRKGLSGFEDYEDGNYLMAAGMVFRVWNEHKEDINDLKAIVKNKPYRKEWQHPFWFVQGCEIQDTWIGKKLMPYDKTLFDLPPTQCFLKKIGMESWERDEHNFIKINGSKAAKFIGTSALRFPVLGAGLYTVMEIDHIRKSDKKLEDTTLAPVRVATIIGCASLGGAAGRNFGRIAEFAGMGTGIIIGCKVAKDYLLAGKPKKKTKPARKLDEII